MPAATVTPLLLLLSLLLHTPSSAQHTETDALIIFRIHADMHGVLAANWSTPSACTGRWVGVSCSSTSNRVVSLSLPSLTLRGTLSPLSYLSQLRILDLRDNRLNGTLAAISSLPNLRLVYLSRNSISGPIPPLLPRHLLRLDLSHNDLRGVLPRDLFLPLRGLLSLNLSDNSLTGDLPDVSSYLPSLSSLDLSNNDFAGTVPSVMLARFGNASFAGNPSLCLSSPCTKPSPAADDPVVIPSSIVTTPHKTLHRNALLRIAIGNAAFFSAVLCLLLFCCCCRHWSQREGKRETDEEEDEQGRGKGRDESDGSVRNATRLVFFDEDDEDDRAVEVSSSDDGKCERKRKPRRSGRNGFELEDLLRASAEMLGKGNLGTVYRAVLGDGSAVAVKRLRDANPCPRPQFEAYMDLIGRLRHPNVVALRAYYYARQEKLLIYDYLPSGTLDDLLHSHRTAQLGWRTRLEIAVEAAKGLSHIHEEHAGTGVPHGNVTSANVLMDGEGRAKVADFGLALLLEPARAVARLGGYRAPEQECGRRVVLSQEADVYAFGVVVLEIVSRRKAVGLVEWANGRAVAEVVDGDLVKDEVGVEEMEGLVRVGMECVRAEVEGRPRMVEVVRMIQRLTGGFD